MCICLCESFLCSILFYLYGDHRDLHSFPTRRSSDLKPHRAPHLGRHARVGHRRGMPDQALHAPERFGERKDAGVRSEEHTSELQSLTNLVCRLLLEKKKKHKKEW